MCSRRDNLYKPLAHRAPKQCPVVVNTVGALLREPFLVPSSALSSWSIYSAQSGTIAAGPGLSLWRREGAAAGGTEAIAEAAVFDDLAESILLAEHLLCVLRSIDSASKH